MMMDGAVAQCRVLSLLILADRAIQYFKKLKHQQKKLDVEV